MSVIKLLLLHCTCFYYPRIKWLLHHAVLMLRDDKIYVVWSSTPVRWHNCCTTAPQELLFDIHYTILCFHSETLPCLDGFICCFVAQRNLLRNCKHIPMKLALSCTEWRENKKKLRVVPYYFLEAAGHVLQKNLHNETGIKPFDCVWTANGNFASSNACISFAFVN